jgi:hypothetical protein
VGVKKPKYVGFDKAYQGMHQPDAFLHKGSAGWAVMPLGAVSEETANQIIAQANVVPQRDGLFGGDSQTWRVSSAAPAPTVKFEDAIGAEIRRIIPCIDCGGLISIVHAGAGPHSAKLVCKACGRFDRWLSRRATETLVTMTIMMKSAFGRSPGVTIRDLEMLAVASDGAVTLGKAALANEPATEDYQMPSVSQEFPSKYIRGGDLKGRSVDVEVDRAPIELVGAEKDKKFVLYFRGRDKALVLNVTNRTFMADNFGDNSEDWAGAKVTLVPIKTTDPKGKLVDSIRLDMQPKRKANDPISSGGPKGGGELDDAIPF